MRLAVLFAGLLASAGCARQSPVATTRPVERYVQLRDNSHLVSQAFLGAWQSTGGFTPSVLVFEADGNYRVVALHQVIDDGRWSLSGTQLTLKSINASPPRQYNFVRESAESLRLEPAHPPQAGEVPLRSYERTIQTTFIEPTKEGLGELFGGC